MKLGAYDYISKPFKSDEILITLKKAEERERLKRENQRLKGDVVREYDIKNIITKDPKMLEVLALVRKVADYSAAVLKLKSRSGFLEKALRKSSTATPCGDCEKPAPPRTAGL
jgi:YesN/AraC family two-component response regulator